MARCVFIRENAFYFHSLAMNITMKMSDTGNMEAFVLYECLSEHEIEFPQI